jgi:hypothetical protein
VLTGGWFSETLRRVAGPAARSRASGTDEAR